MDRDRGFPGGVRRRIAALLLAAGIALSDALSGGRVLAAAADRPARELRQTAQAALPRGDYEAARRDAAAALDLDLRSRDEAGQAADYSLLGQAAIYLGSYAEAISHFEKSLGIDRRRGDGEGETVTLYNLGNASFYLGRYQESFERYQEAIRVLDRHQGEPWEKKRRPIAAANLANLYQRLGRYQKALELYLDLVPGLDRVSTSERARLLANLGTLYRRLGDPVKALDTYREAQRYFAAERHREGEISVLKNIGIALALDLGRLPEALRVFEAARRRAKESNSGQAASCDLYLGETLWRLGRPAEAAEKFSHALRGGPEYEWRALHGLGRIEQAAGRMEAALRHYQDAITRNEAIRGRLTLPSLRSEFLAEKRDPYDSAIGLLADMSNPETDRIFRLLEDSRSRLLQEHFPAISLSGLRRLLPQGTALLEYWDGGDRGAVLAVSGSAETLSRRGRLDPGLWRSDARRAGTDLLGGLALLDDPRIETLIVVPDGRLQAVPFEALALPGSGRLLIERYNVYYLPAASALALNARGGARWAWPWERRLLAFADPVYSSDSPLGSRWEPLPKAREEAAAISKLMGGRNEVLAGADARKERLVSYPIVHFATHAASAEEDAERSRIALAGGDLFLREIYPLDFRRTELAVLSACETESGRLVRGEGVEAFSRAFLSAGAGATVTTLWRVEDSSAAEFMKQFYARLARGQTPAEALRGAKLAFLRSGQPFADPRHWAAFVLNGGGQRRLPRAISWTELAAAAAVASVLGFLLARRRRRRA